MSVADFFHKIHLPRFKIPKVRVPSVFIVLPGRPKKNNGKNSNGVKEIKCDRPLLLDTSAIIDGRIAEVGKSGFLDGTLIVPQFILLELQTLADSKNSLKRNRGRFGLTVLETIKKNTEVNFKTLDVVLKEKEAVDQALIRLAKKIKGKIVTVDYNLNKLGKIAGVRILNVNELANMVKSIVIPGESLLIKVIQTGKENTQGVGYLPDGTMVVVEGGKELLGQEVETVVERLFQTEAGRMIFVKIKDQKSNIKDAY